MYPILYLPLMSMVNFKKRVLIQNSFMNVMVLFIISNASMHVPMKLKLPTRLNLKLTQIVVNGLAIFLNVLNVVA